MKAILSKHLLFLFMLAAAFLTASTGVCYHAVRVLGTNQHWVIHSHEVLGRIEAARASLATAEGNQRNYLFTGRDDYLATYDDAGRRAKDEIDGLVTLVADNPAQRGRAETLRQAASDRLGSLAQGLEKFRAGGIESARAWAVAGTGRQAMDRAMSTLATMEREEYRLLAARAAQSESSLVRMVVTFSLVGLLSVGLLGVIFFSVRQEVASRAAAAQQLQESEARMLLAVEAAELGIWEHDLLAGRIISSGRCQAMFGLPAGEPVTADAVTGRLHPEDRERFLSVVRGATEPGGQGEYTIEYRVVWPDGQVRWIRSRGRAVFDGTPRRAVRLVGTMVDITDARRAAADLLEAKEKAEAANRAKDQFLAVLSHELRTPLTPVLAAVSDLEQRPELPAGVREDLATVRRNVELEARLIDDLLDLTRIARGKVQLHPEVIDLHVLITSVVGMFSAEANEKRLALRLRLDASRHHVWGDPGRLQQVLWNLVSNSLKFTPPGGEIAVRTAAAGDERVLVEVRDTGIGIEREALPRLFNAFEQGEQTIARRFGGLGLGLSIAKTIADMHGGELLAESAGRDRGTTFRLTLNAVDAQKPAADSATSVAPDTGKKDGKLRILLVEDNEDTRRLMGRLLRLFGHHVEAADCVAAAVELASRESFDLLVSDIGLPDGTGWDLMGKLGDRRPAKAIALSGFGMEDDLRRSREAGFLEHITKPVNITELRAVIERMGTN